MKNRNRTVVILSHSFALLPKKASVLAALICALAVSSGNAATTYYWDPTGNGATSSGSNGSGTWSGTTNFSNNSGTGVSPVQWSANPTLGDTINIGTAANTGTINGGTITLNGGGSNLVFGYGGVPVTATGTSGSNQLTVNSSSGLSLGQVITGGGIPTGTTITNISGTTVTLSNNLTSSSSGGAFTAGTTVTDTMNINQNYTFASSASPVLAATTTATATAGTPTVTVASATGLTVGQQVFGYGVPAGTTITGISGNTITLSNNTSTALTSSTSPLLFYTPGTSGGGLSVGNMNLASGVTATFQSEIDTGGLSTTWSLNTGSTLNLSGGGQLYGVKGSSSAAGAETLNISGGTYLLGIGQGTGTLGTASTGTSTSPVSFTVNQTGGTIYGGFNMESYNTGSSFDTSTYNMTGGTLNLVGMAVSIGGQASGSSLATSIFNLKGGTIVATGEWRVGNDNGQGTFNVSSGIFSSTTDIALARTGGVSSLGVTDSMNVSGGIVGASQIQFGRSGQSYGTGSTATLNITGGTLLLNGTGATTQSFIFNSLTNLTNAINLGGGTLGLANGQTGLWNVPMTLTGTNGDVTLQTAQGTAATGVTNTGTSENVFMSGVLSGAGGLIKTGGSTVSTTTATTSTTVPTGVSAYGGVLVLSAANTYAGKTTIDGGELRLDFGITGAPTSNIINNTSNASALHFGAGAVNNALLINGAASAVANSQQFNGTFFDAGSATIIMAQNSASSVTLNMGGITRSAGATANFSTVPSSTVVYNTSATNDATGILGSWATVGNSTSLAYASVSGGTVGSYTGATAATSGLANVTSSGTNFSLASGDTLAAAATANTLQYTGGVGTLDLSSSNLTLNGILNSGSGVLSIASTGGGKIVIGSNHELDITTNSNGMILNGVVIADNPDGTPSSLVFTGVASTAGGSSNSALQMNTVSTYTGGTIINQGQIQLNNGLALQNSTVTLNGGQLSFNSITGAVIGGLSGSGFQTLNNLGSQGVTLQVGGNNASTTYSGNLSGTGSLTKAGSGTLTLTGTNTFAGRTTINAGTLAVSGSGSIASGVTVASNSATNAILAGTGSISGGVIVGGGTGTGQSLVDAGGVGAIGTLTVGSGGLSFASGGAPGLSFEINSSTSTIDLLSITGTLALGTNIATFSGLDLGSGTVSSNLVFILAQASGGITGNFTGYADGSDITIGGYQYQINYGSLTGYANDLTLMEIAAVAVPEPGTWVLLFLGAAMLGVVARRRQGSASA